ncbi:MAG: c-type cytochrome domain-containing protein [Planctomycetota bacterium]
MNHAIERQTLRVLIWVLGLMLTATGASDLVAQSPDYNRQVLPILSNHCFACHGPDSQARAADLRLDDIPGLLAAGGEIIVPGKSEESELVRRLLSDDEDELMPPPDHTPPLSPDQLATLG